jgi:hypothetical protein
VSIFKEDLGRRRLLYKLAIARADVQSAREVARYAEEHVQEFTDALWIPLQEALVIAYSRPFSANKPFGPLASRWAKFESAEHQKLHKDLLQIRDELVAHADASRRRVLIFPPPTHSHHLQVCHPTQKPPLL